MGRQAAPSSRNSQKWQVAGNFNSETTSGNVQGLGINAPSEDGGSTRLASSGDASPSPSMDSTYHGIKNASADREEESVSKKEDRERWADVVDDGEAVVVFESRHLHSVMEAPQHEERSVAGRRAKNGKLRPPMDRPVKSTPPAARSTPQASAPSVSTATKRLDDSHKPAPAPYRPPKPDVRQNVAQQSRHHDTSYQYSWEASSWGTSGSGWKSSSKAHDTSWSEGAWDRKQDVYHSTAHVPKFDSHKGRGGKEKNESFKRGPAVTTNMDASRLAW